MTAAAVQNNSFLPYPPGRPAALELRGMGPNERPVTALELAVHTQRARKNLSATEAYFRSQYGLAGYDGKGTVPRLELYPDFPNALADSERGVMALGKVGPRWLGDEKIVVAHEYTHFVLNSATGTRGDEQVQVWYQRADLALREANTLRRDGVADTDPRIKHLIAEYQRNLALAFQYPAITEALADILGAAFAKTWDMGGFRNPSTGKNVITHMRQFPARHTSHDASGVVSNAASDVQRAVGWNAMGKIFYAVLADERFDHASTFYEVALLAHEHAGRQLGSPAAESVRLAFRDNGIRIPVRTGLTQRVAG